MDGLEKIVELIARYKWVEKVLFRDSISMLSVDMEAAITKLYTYILNFQARAASQFDHKTIKRISRNILKRDGWESLLKQISAADDECVKLMGVMRMDSSDRRIAQLQKSVDAMYILDDVDMASKPKRSSAAETLTHRVF